MPAGSHDGHVEPHDGGFLRNLAASTFGNIVGGAILVGIVYWFVYLRPPDDGL